MVFAIVKYLCVFVLSCSAVQLFTILGTGARQAPQSMGFSRQEYWSRLSCPSPGDLPEPGIETVSAVSLALQVDSLPAERLSPHHQKSLVNIYIGQIQPHWGGYLG